MWKKQRFRALKSQVWMALIVSEGKTLLDLYQRIKKWSTWALASLIQWCWNINWTLHLSPSLHQVHKISDGTVLSQWFRSYWKQPHPQTEHIPRRRWWLPPTYQCPLYRPPPHILSGASWCRNPLAPVWTAPTAARPYWRCGRTPPAWTCPSRRPRAWRQAGWRTWQWELASWISWRRTRQDAAPWFWPLLRSLPHRPTQKGRCLPRRWHHLAWPGE